MFKMKKTLLLFIGLILFSFSYGQAIIKGKVTDKKTGETLIGVTLSLKSKPGVGVTTNLDGEYTLTLPDATVETLVISYISYETMEVMVHPVTGETINKDFALQSVSQSLGTIEIGIKATKAKEYYMEKIKMNSSSSINFISNETMKKTGDVNVTAAVARVSGVSISNGFISVRGISDRYVKTTINGSRIPTLDPFTNNIRLDLFPASLIDNVILTKTASPDLPGDWAGAYISLETKDYPDKLSVNLETSVGYNQQTSFKDVISSQRSSTDWLGYDNGFREYDHNAFVSGVHLGDVISIDNMTIYQQLVGLGLKDYLNSMGVTAETLHGKGYDNVYFIMGLVQLGLLDKELQTNQAAIKTALDKYNTGGYKEKAFENSYHDVAASGKGFKNNWTPTRRKAPLNFSQSISIGNETKFLGRTLGILAGLRYGSGIQYDPHSINQRVAFSSKNTNGTNDIRIDTMLRETSKETNSWSALLSLAYKLNINNSIAFIFMPNYTGVNNVNSQRSEVNPPYTAVTQAQFYEQRKQLIYQFKSKHLIPGPRIQLTFDASYTKGKSSAPDYKTIVYTEAFLNNTMIFGFNGGSDDKARYFRYLTDDVFDSKASAEIPLKNSTDDLLKTIKVGVAYQDNYKKNDQYQYIVQATKLPPGTEFNGDLEAFLNPDIFSVQKDENGSLVLPAFYYSESSPQNHSFGKSTVKSGFAMLDYALFPYMRVSGGLRVEQANIYTDIVKFDAMHLKPDDQRRFINGDIGLVNPGTLNKISYLPSVNVIFKLKKDPEAPINLRMNYSQTVARPSIRELSGIAVADYEYGVKVQGNPNLKMARVKNYDLRLESYFKSGDNASISLFYKDFRDHIEMVNYTVVSWQNVDKSHAYGIELEGRKAITKHFEFRANVTFVKSQTTFVRYISYGNILLPVDTIKRSMFGQAPYVLNGMLVYKADSIGLTLTVSYNVQGPRLALSSVRQNVPDIYELPRQLLDFKVTKKLGKHFSASLTVRDILNSAITRAYKFDTWDVKYDSYKYGTNYVLGISYQL
jgi:outer membrane receptor protein involved in Fe transport